ncbi:integron integrase, partial [Desulfatitalea alkaliphila]
MDQVRHLIRCKHYSIRTEQVYVDWIRRYIYFHHKRHPSELGEEHVSAFLTDLAVRRKVAASTQNQALCALVFLYKEVVKKDLGEFQNVVRAKRPQKLPVVFTREEVKALLVQLDGTAWIMGNMLYGAGLRLMECVRLRVKDIDFGYKQIVVRDGKGAKDRVTMLPEILIDPLQRHLLRTKALHEADLRGGFGSVYLPFALERKYANAGRSWSWQYVFPASRRSVDPRSGIERRHHVSEAMLQRAVKAAICNAEIA